MAIGDDVIRACKTMTDIQSALRDEFRAGKYEDVFDGIQRFHALATANRGQARRRLFDYVVAFTSNYVVAPAIGGGDFLDWETAFPELLERLRHPREESWRDFLLDRATFRREGLREAIEIILATCTEFGRGPLGP